MAIAAECDTLSLNFSHLLPFEGKPLPNFYEKNVMSDELFLGSHLCSFFRHASQPLGRSSHSHAHKNFEAVTYTGQWSHNNLSPSDSDVTIIKGFVAQRHNYPVPRIFEPVSTK